MSDLVMITEKPEDVEICKNILTKLKELPDAMWVDRTRTVINYGINGEIGDYKSLNYGIMPEDIKELVMKIVPTHPKIPFNNFMINKYEKGKGFIPMHNDLIDTLGFAIITLTDNPGDGISYIDKGETLKVQDKIGNQFIPMSNSLIHGVIDPVTDDRYSIIVIYC